ncbi:MAG TPA: NAD-dependent epimerase/dehydratase family protein [Pirellulaceae bacterium]|nr:NAD-dependent epimerase/dehydratase family protein [Pirellulaceae bacterium]
MAKLVFGCGYLGFRVARLWRQRGDDVLAVTRSAEKGPMLAREGLRPIVADLAGAALDLGPLPAIDTVLFAVGYDRGSAAAIEQVYAGGVAQAVAAIPATVTRFIYVSSTGVYGDAAGESVDEETACRPTRAGGKASLAAEELLHQSQMGQRTIVLRMAGLYGPGRIPRAEAVLAGEPIDAPASGFLNLIHVDDAAAIVLLAEERAPLPRTYVVSDGQSVLRSEYYAELARLLGAPPPRFVAPDATSPAAQRAASDKRVNNRRMMSELSPVLRYPSYREGLAAIVAERGAQFD